MKEGIGWVDKRCIGDAPMPESAHPQVEVAHTIELARLRECERNLILFQQDLRACQQERDQLKAEVERLEAKVDTLTEQNELLRLEDSNHCMSASETIQELRFQLADQERDLRAQLSTKPNLTRLRELWKDSRRGQWGRNDWVMEVINEVRRLVGGKEGE